MHRKQIPANNAIEQYPVVIPSNFTSAIQGGTAKANGRTNSKHERNTRFQGEFVSARISRS